VRNPLHSCGCLDRRAEPGDDSLGVVFAGPTAASAKPNFTGQPCANSGIQGFKNPSLALDLRFRADDG